MLKKEQLIEQVIIRKLEFRKNLSNITGEIAMDMIFELVFKVSSIIYGWLTKVAPPPKVSSMIYGWLTKVAPPPKQHPADIYQWFKLPLQQQELPPLDMEDLFIGVGAIFLLGFIFGWILNSFIQQRRRRP